MTTWFEKPNAAMAFCIALDAVRDEEGAAVTVLCDNPEAETTAEQSAVEVTASWTGWEPRRFYGLTPLEAMLAAGIEQARAR